MEIYLIMLKKISILLAVAFCFAATTQGAVVLLDDFSTYSLGQIHGQGNWETNRNTSAVQPADGSKVVADTVGGGQVLAPGNTVIIESTVYPGATEEFCVPILQRESGLQLNRDFGVGYSPERVSPGSGGKALEDIVKVTAGSRASRFLAAEPSRMKTRMPSASFSIARRDHLPVSQVDQFGIVGRMSFTDVHRQIETALLFSQLIETEFESGIFLVH